MTAQILQSWSLLLIVALGGLLSERGGILNIGLEGFITFGAFTAIVAGRAGMPAATAVAAGAAAGLIPAAIFAHFSLRWNANPFIVGLAINALAAGTVPLLSELIFETRGSIRLDTRGLGVGEVLLTAAGALVFVQIFLYHTPSGLRLRVAGEQPDWLIAQRVGLKRYRLLALLVGSALAAASGALLALRLGVYLPNISAGRGWIGLVIIFLGYRTPVGLAFAALFFGLVEALGVRAQSALGLPPTVLLALPYILTVVAFVGYSALRTRRATG